MNVATLQLSLHDSVLLYWKTGENQYFLDKNRYTDPNGANNIDNLLNLADDEDLELNTDLIKLTPTIAASLKERLVNEDVPNGKFIGFIHMTPNSQGNFYLASFGDLLFENMGGTDTYVFNGKATFIPLSLAASNLSTLVAPGTTHLQQQLYPLIPYFINYTAQTINIPVEYYNGSNLIETRILPVSYINNSNVISYDDTVLISAFKDKRLPEHFTDEYQFGYTFNTAGISDGTTEKSYFNADGTYKSTFNATVLNNLKNIAAQNRKIIFRYTIKNSKYIYVYNSGSATVGKASKLYWDKTDIYHLYTIQKNNKVLAFTPPLGNGGKTFVGYFNKEHAMGYRYVDEDGYVVREINLQDEKGNPVIVTLFAAFGDPKVPDLDFEIEQLPGIKAVKVGPYLKDDGITTQEDYYKIAPIAKFGDLTANPIHIGDGTTGAVLAYDFDNDVLTLSFEETV